MSLASPPLLSTVMAKKREETEQLNVRVRTSTIERLDAFLDSEYPQPIKGQIVDIAINEWLDRRQGAKSERKGGK